MKPRYKVTAWAVLEKKDDGLYSTTYWYTVRERFLFFFYPAIITFDEVEKAVTYCDALNKLDELEKQGKRTYDL